MKRKYLIACAEHSRRAHQLKFKVIPIRLSINVPNVSFLWVLPGSLPHLLGHKGASSACRGWNKCLLEFLSVISDSFSSDFGHQQDIFTLRTGFDIQVTKTPLSSPLWHLVWTLAALPAYVSKCSQLPPCSSMVDYIWIGVCIHFYFDLFLSCLFLGGKIVNFFSFPLHAAFIFYRLLFLLLFVACFFVFIDMQLDLGAKTCKKKKKKNQEDIWGGGRAVEKWCKQNRGIKVPKPFAAPHSSPIQWQLCPATGVISRSQKLFFFF